VEITEYCLSANNIILRSLFPVVYLFFSWHSAVGSAWNQTVLTKDEKSLEWLGFMRKFSGFLRVHYDEGGLERIMPFSCYLRLL
jgi:hypothetical protein